MQEAVQYQMRSIGNELHDGDVILTNHPAAGGHFFLKKREEIHP
jgi:5-oxoprolinase (ATP-hydrolysing)